MSDETTRQRRQREHMEQLAANDAVDDFAEDVAADFRAADLEIAELRAALTAVRAERDEAQRSLDVAMELLGSRTNELAAVRAERDGLRGALEAADRAVRAAVTLLKAVRRHFDDEDDDAEVRMVMAAMESLTVSLVPYKDARRALSTAGGAQDGNRPAESPGIGSDLATVDATPRAPLPEKPWPE